jgi:hypothetical protein
MEGWEEGTPRTVAGLKNRVPMLRSLGNSVVPRIPEIIGRVLMEEEWES